MKNKEDRAIEEALEAISDGQEELREIKKVLYDKTTSQYSIKIPKSLALKSGTKEDSEFIIMVNPKEETIKDIKSKIIIFKRGEKDGEGKENT